MIYLVTVMKHHDDPRPRRERSWGYYFKFEDAEQAVLSNATDMFEDGYYREAVIEEVPEGIIPFAKAKQWYVADYPTSPNDDGNFGDPVVRKVDPPEWSTMAVNWGIG